MRTIERISQFKRESRGRHRKSLDAVLVPVLKALAGDRSLEPRHHDHALSGNWSGQRDRHVKPDLVLIYQKPDPGTLRLVRLGSHSELGLRCVIRRGLVAGGGGAHRFGLGYFGGALRPKTTCEDNNDLCTLN